MLEIADQEAPTRPANDASAATATQSDRSQGEDISTSPLEMLERLVDNSLIMQLPAADDLSSRNGQARFTMLETLREYAVEQLLSHDELERLRDWHTGHYLQEAEAAELGLRGPQQLTWLARLRAERDNFRTALEWSLQRARDGLRIHISVHPTQNPPTPGRIVAGSSTLSAQSGSSADPLALELALRLSS